METRRISSIRNPLLRTIRAILAGKEKSLIIVEGRKFCRDALEKGLSPVEVLASENIYHSGEIRWLEDGEIPRVTVVPEKTFQRISTVKSPQGIMMLFPRPSWEKPQVLGDRREETFVLLLSGVQDPGNVGTLFRSGKGAGISGVMTWGGTADPLSPKALRASAGSSLFVPHVELKHAREALAFLEENSLPLYCADPGGIHVLWDSGISPPMALALGSEGRGLEGEVVQASRKRIAIPLKGRVESLNVAVAGSLIMFWAMEKRRVRGG